MSKEESNYETSYEKSVELLKRCLTKDGFTASLNGNDKYKRIWGRDSMICSLATLLTDDKNLIRGAKYSLKTLIKFQHKHGQIPSNVDVKNKKVSYGGSTGRVDAILWFLVGFVEYIKKTNDLNFLKKNYKKFKRAYELLTLYEFNNKGFIYIPLSGDWADEYIQEGYVLYDELLYLKSIEGFIYLRKKLHKKIDKLENKRKDLRKKILINFIPEKKNKSSEEVYDSILFNKTLNKKKFKTPYLLPYFNPSDYGFRFDGFANSLALALGILPKEKEKKLIKYVKKNFSRNTKFLIPAFYPVITKTDPDWSKLKENYSVKFRNVPHEYHNGGLWPMITGFFAAGLTKFDKKEAKKYLGGINYANSRSREKKQWGFSEFLNSENFSPKGTAFQAWSAAAGIIAYKTVIEGRKLFA